MKYTDPFPILLCDDLSAVIGFYRGLLGFTEGYRYPPDGEPEFMVLRGASGPRTWPTRRAIRCSSSPPSRAGSVEE